MKRKAIDSGGIIKIRCTYHAVPLTLQLTKNVSGMARHELRVGIKILVTQM